MKYFKNKKTGAIIQTKDCFARDYITTGEWEESTEKAYDDTFKVDSKENDNLQKKDKS